MECNGLNGCSQWRGFCRKFGSGANTNADDYQPVVLFAPEPCQVDNYQNERDIKDILKEFAIVRQATISLFEGFNGEALMRAGGADGEVISVRAAAYRGSRTSSY
jgi:hypothetical protein